MFEGPDPVSGHPDCEALGEDDVGVYLADGSAVGNPGHTTSARIDQLVDETADHRGEVTFAVHSPEVWTSTVDIIQEWCLRTIFTHRAGEQSARRPFPCIQ